MTPLNDKLFFAALHNLEKKGGDSIITRLERYLFSRHIRYQKDVSLGAHTSFRIGGNVLFWIQPSSISECMEVLFFLRRSEIPFRVIGRGTNILCVDEPRKIVVLSTTCLARMMESGGDLIAECGVSFHQLCMRALSHGMVGFAGLAGIPGSVGAGIRINAGAFGDEVTNHLRWVELFDTVRGNIRILEKKELAYGYRRTFLLSCPDYMVMRACFSFPPGDTAKEKMMIRANMLRRCLTQPHGLPSAGSVFRREEGISAGKRIDDAGGKGMRVGDAVVSDKHANFIVNTGHATCQDVCSLMERVRECVYAKSGVYLSPEIELFP